MIMSWQLGSLKAPAALISKQGLLQATLLTAPGGKLLGHRLDFKRLLKASAEVVFELGFRVECLLKPPVRLL